MVTLEDYPATTTAWCPGCGNFGILTAVRKALVACNLAPHQVLLVSGIGQAGKLPHYTRVNTLNELHGRALPAATGAKIANHELTVVVVGGDGDGYGEGGNHFIHAMYRNMDMTYIVHDNQVYGLTKGQASPTSDPGFVTKTTLEGAWAQVNPMVLGVATDTSFVARGFAGDIDHLAGLIAAGIQHKGFALIDVLQPCVSFNPRNTYKWYRERVYKLDQDKAYDATDRSAAFVKAQEWGDRVPIGVIYKKDKPTFESSLPAIKKMPLVRQPLDPRQIEPLLDEFM
ncbi:MAG: 2-oxoacid ferredoxin oxidoreductase [Chloroflexi bacterium]|nr:2-oxoacid ferredoxin oxidoreductase [Chloroflexota bacterium]